CFVAQLPGVLPLPSTMCFGSGGGGRGARGGGGRAARATREPLVLGDAGLRGLPVRAGGAGGAGGAVSVLERGLGAVFDAQLREEVLHVEFDGVVRQPEAPGNLRVRQAGGDQRPHIALAGGAGARSA